MRHLQSIAAAAVLLLLCRCAAVEDATKRSGAKDDEEKSDGAGDEAGDAGETDAPGETDTGILEDEDDVDDEAADDGATDTEDGDGDGTSGVGETQNGVVFCQGGGKDLKLDIVRPSSVSLVPRPGLIFVHGGGWTSGSRSAFTQETKAAAAEGYISATIEYRLTGALFPGQVEDVKCAVRWMRANAALYDIDPDHIGLVGKSAGAHLSMLAAFSDEGEMEGAGGHAGTSSKVKAVIDWYGPADMAALYNSLPAQKRVGMELMLGGTPATAAATYSAASPVTYLDAQDPALFIAHGTADGTVPIAQSQGLDTKAGTKNITHAFETIQGAAHGFKDADYDFVWDKTLDFLNANL